MRNSFVFVNVCKNVTGAQARLYTDLARWLTRKIYWTFGLTAETVERSIESNDFKSVLRDIRKLRIRIIILNDLWLLTVNYRVCFIEVWLTHLFKNNYHWWLEWDLGRRIRQFEGDSSITIHILWRLWTTSTNF